ncbi:MAG: ABC transporter ATP-binding protein [Chloroflexi bacterium]|nr:MAG: ABC transporter ATP-binding protein [Chloroflexota bacterium]
MTIVLETSGLTKRYGRTDALRGCDLSLAGGKVTGLVGPNGAGKTTLLNIAVGLHRPTAGRIRVLGLDPWREGVALLSRIGFVAQDRPLHGGFTVAETLEIGRRLNPRWDQAYALARVKHFGLPLDRRVRSLSTGQRAQVALTLALGKRPEVLLLDEPVANLDPVARLELLEELMGVFAEDGPSDALVREHVLVSGPRRAEHERAEGEVIEVRQAERQTTRLLRGHATQSDDGTEVRPATLEEIVVGYLRSEREEVPQ